MLVRLKIGRNIVMMMLLIIMLRNMMSIGLIREVRVVMVVLYLVL